MAEELPIAEDIKAEDPVRQDDTGFLFPFATSTLDESGDIYAIDAEYPVIEDSEVNDRIAKFVTGTVASFIADANAASDYALQYGRKYMLWMEFDAHATEQYQSFVFRISVDMGGAHPNHLYETFTFDAAGSLVTIQDLVQREYHDQRVFFEISDLVQAELRAQLGEEAAASSWIGDGAGPEPTNFEDFYITDDTMHFLFEPYAIGPYALSSREAAVRFDEVTTAEEFDSSSGE